MTIVRFIVFHAPGSAGFNEIYCKRRAKIAYFWRNLGEKPYRKKHMWERSAERTMVGPAERSGQVPHPVGIVNQWSGFRVFTKPERDQNP